jgi:hypothetical protein
MSLKAASKVCLIVILLFMGVAASTLAEKSGKISQTFIYPTFDTAGWVNTQMSGRLLIRSGTNGKNILLTMCDEFEKGNRHRVVYEYDPKAKSLQKVSNLNWDGLASPISECFSQSQQFPGKFKVTGEKLFFGIREVSIKGAVFISAAFSPSGRYVAILSADGPRKGSLMPFFGGGQNSKGQHYHQLFSVYNGEPISDVLKLQLTTEKEAYPACWSIDEKYFFYTALLADKLTIVETGFSNK